MGYFTLKPAMRGIFSWDPIQYFKREDEGVVNFTRPRGHRREFISLAGDTEPHRVLRSEPELISNLFQQESREAAAGEYEDIPPGL